jgi:RNA polymerase sigma-70 factor (sigma-E family)
MNPLKPRSDFSEYVVARRPALLRMAYGLTGSWHTADDVVQAALTRAYVAWPRIHSGGTEDAYVRRIVVRTAISESRRPWRRESPGIDGLDVTAATGVTTEDRDELIDALMTLPEMQRRVVVLRHWMDLSVADTARDLGIPEGTVKVYTSRALTRLQTLLADRPTSTTRRTST